LEELWKLPIEIRFLDQRELIPESFRFVFEHAVTGELITNGDVIHLDDIEAVYLRPYDFRLLPQLHGLDGTSELWRKVAYFHDSMSLWCDTTPAFVVNRPSAMASNSSKPYQLEIIRQIGFSVPDTILTTDPDFARQFCKKHGQVIYKSISGVRSIVSRLQESQQERLADVIWCPTQFQQYIGGIDHRVHVVGSDVFSCRLICADDDYRYSPWTSVSPYMLPLPLQEKCIALSEKLQLPFTGIDLRQTPEGEWFCFEANPCPGFSYFEQASGDTISAAVARMLVSA